MSNTNASFNREILYEDNHIIAVNKQASDIVQGDKTGDTPLSEPVKNYLKIKYKKPGNVFLGVVHRLDRPVSGVVVFARTGKALARLNEMIKKREVHKAYWAVVKTKPPRDEDTLTHFLQKNERQNKSYPVKPGNTKAKEANLKYRLIATSDNYYLLEIILLTGRHHQIRAQLSAIGCPVKGDLKYGFPRNNTNASIHLHARSISFIHPVKKENIIIKANPPDDPLWNHFQTP